MTRRLRQGNIRKRHSVKLRKRQTGGGVITDGYSILANNVEKKAVRISGFNRTRDIYIKGNFIKMDDENNYKLNSITLAWTGTDIKINDPVAKGTLTIDNIENNWFEVPNVVEETTLKDIMQKYLQNQNILNIIFYNIKKEKYIFTNGIYTLEFTTNPETTNASVQENLIDALIDALIKNYKITFSSEIEEEMKRKDPDAYMEMVAEGAIRFKDVMENNEVIRARQVITDRKANRINAKKVHEAANQQFRAEEEEEEEAKEEAKEEAEAMEEEELLDAGEEEVVWPRNKPRCA